MHLYVHIPFCQTKCPYCAFYSCDYTSYQTVHTYIDALICQFDHYVERYAITSIETLYIGGGTPSLLHADLYAPLFERVAPFLNHDAEISIESNPNNVTRSWLEGIRDLGVNRLSIGVQSFFPEKLHQLGRDHDPRSIHESLEHAADIGFDSLSIDLIIGTSYDTPKHITQELQTALNQPIDHLSLYMLSLEPNTPFAHAYHLQSCEENPMAHAADIVQSAGFKWYEVSNFGRPCQHNLGYWAYKDYLGIGAGAVGMVGHERHFMPTNLSRYIASPTEHRTEVLDPQNRCFERLFLGLRSYVGVEDRYLTPAMRHRAKMLEKEQLLCLKRGRWHNQNFLLADEMALFIMG